MRITYTLCLLLFPTVIQAQVVLPYGPHASTAQEGYLNGLARLRAAEGLYHQYMGQYLMDYEAARSHSIDNWAKGIRTRWDIRDEYKERNKRPSYLDRKLRNMEMAIKRHEVEKMEDRLIHRGILPPRPTPKFVYKGHVFRNYAEFKQSDLYWDMIQEREARKRQREKEEVAAQARYNAAVKNMAKWSRMAPLEREMYFERKRRQEQVEQYLKNAPSSDNYKVMPLKR